MVQPKKHRALVLVLAGGCIPGMLTGCSGNSTTSGSSSPTADYSGASNSTAADVTASVGSMTSVQSSSSAGAMALPVRGVNLHRDAITGGKGCGTVVVNSTGTGGQVTDETITYALPACEFAGVRGIDTLAITGALELSWADVTGLNFTATPTALEYAFTDAGVVSSETRSGTRTVTATASSASLVNAITTQFVKAGAATGTLVDGLTLSFTPASGASLAFGQPIPDGTLQADGTISWTKAGAGAVADSFTVSTITPLAYDSSCAGTSASPFDSGELRLVITDGSVKSYGQITWTNCAAPVITVI
jgi:hypothetical protein